MSAAVSQSRLHSFPNEDLYLFVETCLMNAQQRLSEVRQVDLSLRYAVLEMLVSELEGASVGITEMQARV